MYAVHCVQSLCPCMRISREWVIYSTCSSYCLYRWPTGPFAPAMSACWLVTRMFYISRAYFIVYPLHCGPLKHPQNLLVITQSKINRFLKLFHWRIYKKTVFIHHTVFHRTFNVFLHYLAKPECAKISSNLKLEIHSKVAKAGWFKPFVKFTYLQLTCNCCNVGLVLLALTAKHDGQQ